MRHRLLWRRVATAAGIYGSALLGILATIVAARRLSTHDFSRFALVFATVSLLQLFLDVTVEEVVVKYGNRYAARADWGRFHRLLARGLQVKLAGGLVGSLAVVGAGLLAPWIWPKLGDVRTPMLIAAAVPLVQAPEGMASAVLLLRSRYDVRALLLTWSMGLRLAAVALGTAYGVPETFVAIVCAQALATGTASTIGWLAARRYPIVPAAALGEDRKPLLRFAVQSTIASSLTSLRGLLPTVLVGVVAQPAQVGYFRIAQAPQTAFSTLSAPARLVLLAEQTRDVEHGRVDNAYRVLARYILAVLAAAAVVVPLVWIFTPELVRAIYRPRYLGAVDAVRLILLAATVQVVFGWAKSFPVSIGRPALRTAGQALELVTLIPLVVVLGSLYGAAGAAGGVLASSGALGVFWTVALARLRRERHAAVGNEAPA
jgi:O-antigen/teichoic acid export membrane protein